jgi:hypothetical protein
VATVVDDATILALVRKAFGRCIRPSHFIARYQEDLEWNDHDQLLRSHTVESIGRKQLGTAGWDPICQIDTAVYYMPALARVLLEDAGADYLCQFLFHLSANRVALFTKAQRDAVAALLRHVRDTRGENVEYQLQQIEEKILLLTVDGH